ncbi:MAG: hypothetical protein M3495_20620 [Pseudomonadota bacterium]|nr:hypothetical protein [Gammaproteobacteria bacterium]MDQ3583850.1 hypothetical protein [Pseudomonadota bacterium]
MSAAAIISRYPLFTRSVNTGASLESRDLQIKVAGFFREFHKRADREQAFDELAEALRQGGAANWDQYGAIGVTDATAEVAYRFLSALPSTLPSPNVGLDPDGEVSFEWLAEKGRVFSVSIGESGRLSYAGMFGPEKTAHGSEPFDDAIPDAVIECVRRLGLQA